jgi:di/tricarboxylate transporter
LGLNGHDAEEEPMRIVAGAVLVLAGVVCIVGGLICEAILEAAKANRAPPTFFTHIGGGFLALFGLALMAGRDGPRPRSPDTE